MSHESPTQPLPPFDDPDADIVIRSCDGVKFRTYKSSLAYVSPVFKTMFSLPQPAAPAEPNESEDGVPVVMVSETGQVLHVLLRLCSPGFFFPQFDDIGLTMRVLEAAKKYDMNWTFGYAQTAYDSALVAQPIYAYFLACVCGQADKAKLAARRCLRIPVSTMVGISLRGLEGLVPLEIFQRLVQYRLASQEVAVDLVRSWKWMIPAPKPSEADQFWLFRPNECCYSKTISEHKDPSGASHKVQEWWALFMRGTQERLERSSHKDAVEFPGAMKIFATKGPMCDNCRSCADRSISAFTGWLSENVEKTLNTVVLEYSDRGKD